MVFRWLRDTSSKESALRARDQYGPARVVTATNVFAHIADVHAVVEAIKSMLAPNGVFISESHYLLDLVGSLQYDAIYHEHLRYYSLRSLLDILERHGLEAVYAEAHTDPRRVLPGVRTHRQVSARWTNPYNVFFVTRIVRGSNRRQRAGQLSPSSTPVQAGTDEAACRC